MSTFHELTITEVKRETADAVSIWFDLKNVANSFRFIPGQYITLNTTINGKSVRRAYSICSSPDEAKFGVAIKKVDGGVFSTYANESLKSGMTIEVGIPEGRFVLNTNVSNQKHYLGIAAGSGITPILSMIKSTLAQEPNSSFSLIYGNKTPDSAIFKAELDQWNGSDKINVSYIFSRSDEEGALFGRVDEGNLNFHLKNKWSEVRYDQVFLCGPEEMIKTAESTLIANGYDDKNILFELFTSSTDTAAIEEIKDGMSEISILLDDETFNFSMNAKKTILDAGLDEDVDIPYSCQGGVCSSCIGKVTSGTVKMVSNAILTEEEMEEGLILTCQAHPTSAKVVVDFDDV